MSRRNQIVIYSILGILAISGWIFGIVISQIDTKNLAIEKSYSQNIMNILNTNSVIATQSAISAINTIQQKESEKATKVADLSAQIDSKTKENASLSKSMADLNVSIHELETAMKCSQPANFKWDYSSNQRMSDQLREYAGDRYEKINSATWTVVWNNSRTAVHYLTGEYKYAYVVSFYGDNGTKFNMIYDLGEQCFLDRQ